LAGVLIVAAGWCLFWYIAMQNAKQSFAQTIAANPTIECAAPQWGGFPFRIALDCASTHSVIEDDNGTRTFDTGLVRAVALAYRPFHVITEIHGPITIAGTAPQAPAVTLAADIEPVRISMVFTDRRPDQISILAEEASGTYSLPAAGIENGAFSAARINVHVRVAQPPQDNAAPLDIAARIDNLVAEAPHFQQLGEDALRISTAQLDGHATAFPLDTTISLTERARRWQADGGRLEVRMFRIESNLLGTESAGDIELDDQGRVEGDLTTAVRGFDSFLDRLLGAELITETQALGAEAILIILGKAAGDAENPALEIETDIKMGSFYFGPFKIAQFSPFF
jgi:hypothetical protein